MVAHVNQNCNTDVYMGLYSDVGSCLGFANVTNKVKERDYSNYREEILQN